MDSQDKEIGAGERLTDIRLGVSPHAALQRLYTGPTMRGEMPRFVTYLAVDIAQALMLGETGLIKPADAVVLVDALIEIGRCPVSEIAADPSYGTLMLQIERHLAQRVGSQIAGHLSTGRSRIDQGATVRRLHERGRITDIMALAVALEDALLDSARMHADTLFVLHTHLQPAQPGLLGQYLLGFAERISDGIARLAWARCMTDRCPLGTAGGNGTRWPVDRRRVASLLGFSDLVVNARLGRDIGYLFDISGALAALVVDLADLATDLQLWSTREYDLLEIGAEFCATSSLFPQKRNPVALEAIRTAAARAAGWQAELVALSRGAGTGDLAMRVGGFVDSMFDTAADALELAAAVIGTVKVNDARAFATLRGNWLTATGLVDLLMEKEGLPSRLAHHVVAELVKRSSAEGTGEDEIDRRALAAAAEPFDIAIGTLDDAAIAKALDPAEFVASIHSEGGAGPKQMQALFARMEGRLAEDKALVVSLEDAEVQAAAERGAALRRLREASNWKEISE